MVRSLTLALTGDVMLGRLVNQTIAVRGVAYPWGDMLPWLHQADCVLINLECALTTHTQPWFDGGGKPFYFRADPAAVGVLQVGRVAFAGLANNHIGDYEQRGLLDTLVNLDVAGIAHAGAGRDLAAARAPAIISCAGWRIAVVAWADYPVAWAATATTPGLNYTPVSLEPAVMATVAETLATARRQADLVIFSIHWGPNMRLRPTSGFRAFARAVLDAGADLFWGHSAHVVQGIELWRGKPILYDTGDFVDDYAVDEQLRNDLSALFLVRVAPPGITGLELVPVKIASMQVTLAYGKDHRFFKHRIAALCDEMGTLVTSDGPALTIAVPPAGSTAAPA